MCRDAGEQNPTQQPPTAHQQATFNDTKRMILYPRAIPVHHLDLGMKLVHRKIIYLAIHGESRVAKEELSHVLSFSASRVNISWCLPINE